MRPTVRMKAFTHSSFAFAISGVLLCSCSQRNTTDLSSQPKPTSPVIGQVLVDGKVADKLSVICHDVDRSTKQNRPRPVGLTDEDGRIEFSSYQKGDGVPEGQYALTFTWGEWDDYWKKSSGPDRLAGRYADPQKSTIRLTVKRGTPTDLGTIQLQTK